jgi:8-amino-7-oxononanoate synthase
MGGFEQRLEDDLAAIHAQGLYRELYPVHSAQQPRLSTGHRTILNFSSNDYLGLANHPELKAAAIRAIECFGVGSGASRLICGSLVVHHRLEETLAAFKGTEAALSFASGYATALGAVCALIGKSDLVIVDHLVHASIVDAARLSGATLRVFKHNELNDLEKKLAWANRLSRGAAPVKRSRVLVVTESVFSMDGDHAPLSEIVELKERHGAILMVDEAHATGLYGRSGQGLANAEGVSRRIDVQMGTLGKALGAAGGYICGSHRLIELLINRARSFIFSTAPVPAAAAAATKAVELVQSTEGQERRNSLWGLVSQLRTGLTAMERERVLPYPVRVDPNLRSAIVPVIVGSEVAAVQFTAALREQGFLIPAIRYPTVARGQARLRLTVTAGHRHDEVTELLAAIRSCGNQVPCTN